MRTILRYKSILINRHFEHFIFGLKLLMNHEVCNQDIGNYNLDEGFLKSFLKSPPLVSLKKNWSLRLFYFCFSSETPKYLV